MGAFAFLLFLVALVFFLSRPAVPPPRYPPDDRGEGKFSQPGDNSVPVTGSDSGGSLFSGASGFVINDSTFIAQENDSVAKGMKALEEHSMKGAAYDSSLRDPPPQCHPGTRVRLVDNIVTWFRNNGREKALLWLNGPAGVGKSAVIQTVAESLAEVNSIGATIFFSRLNNRNDPRRVFITIAFQLATSIPEYKTYVTKRIALDPSLLEKAMKDQFRIFIAEPFGKRGIGKGKGFQAVLLDGLDECEGVEDQRRIVQLVTEFVLTFPDAPLVWVISSRPEPHIIGTFSDKAVASSHWSEYMPVDSTQACLDVEHYLDASFKDMRKPFPHLPQNWPSETHFLKLSHGAQGLFAFARTAVRFMEDSDHANPVSRLNMILSIIDHLDISVIDDHPFALLDALYAQILSYIPPSVWPTTKRILGFIICTQPRLAEDGLSYTFFGWDYSFIKLSIVLGLDPTETYSSLHKLHSVLDIPDSKNAPHSQVTFVHASFGDYLTDRARSKGSYIDRGESVDEITRCLFQLYLDKPWESEWGQYAFQLSPVTKQELSRTLKGEVEGSVYFAVTGELRSQRGTGPFKSQQDRLECLSILGQISPIEVYKLGAFKYKPFCAFLLRLWDEFQEELEGTGLFKMITLGDLKMEHLDHGRNQIVFVQESPPPHLSNEDTLRGSKREQRRHFLSRIMSLGVQRMDPRQYVEKIREGQGLYPESLVMIYGSLPEKRVAFFEGKISDDDEGYFCFPYPD